MDRTTTGMLPPLFPASNAVAMVELFFSSTVTGVQRCPPASNAAAPGGRPCRPPPLSPPVAASTIPPLLLAAYSSASASSPPIYESPNPQPKSRRKQKIVRIEENITAFCSELATLRLGCLVTIGRVKNSVLLLRLGRLSS
nr:hypothetical protein Iba_chr15cCG7430 [Ipomoea batatas]